MSQPSQIHTGHRQRLKDRFLQEGLDHFSQVNALELLLFYCVPRKDTNPLAHKLLDHFGKLHNVLEASYEELMKVDGVNSNIATYLTMIHAAGRYYVKNRNQENVILTTIEQCGEYLMPHFHGLQDETVFLLCLDAKCKVLSCKKVGEGSVNSAAVPIRRIVEMALGANATSVVLAHNHPSGLAIPSDEDGATTMRLAKALKTVDIHLVDHIVVADNEFVSLYQSGLYIPG
jgi:DNA repair protein RadC